MKSLSAMVIAFLAALSLSCTPSTPSPNKPDANAVSARQTVQRGIDAQGGPKVWDSSRTIEADALVTIYNAEGEARVERQHMTISPADAEITATGRSPYGPWKVSAKPDDIGPLNADRKTALAVIANRIRGPWNIRREKDYQEPAHAVFVAGKDLVEVLAKPDAADVVAYYFNRGDGLLHFVTAGANAPGQKGSVTLYEYMTLSDGTRFPRSITIVAIGRYVLVGETPLLEVEFSNVTID